jgi:hypothetical protein
MMALRLLLAVPSMMRGLDARTREKRASRLAAAILEAWSCETAVCRLSLLSCWLFIQGTELMECSGNNNWC